MKRLLLSLLAAACGDKTSNPPPPEPAPPPADLQACLANPPPMAGPSATQTSGLAPSPM